MSDQDVVAELDHWIEETLVGEVFRSLVRRARDEIVALRKNVADLDSWKLALLYEASATGRDGALEEAAKIIESRFQSYFADPAAVAIRALKDKT